MPRSKEEIKRRNLRNLQRNFGLTKGEVRTVSLFSVSLFLGFSISREGEIEKEREKEKGREKSKYTKEKETRKHRRPSSSSVVVSVVVIIRLFSLDLDLGLFLSFFLSSLFSHAQNTHTYTHTQNTHPGRLRHVEGQQQGPARGPEAQAPGVRVPQRARPGEESSVFQFFFFSPSFLSPLPRNSL